MRLQGCDVDFKEQTYTTIVKKGGERPVKSTIRNTAMEFWVEQMKDCKPTDYVFGEGLLPSVKSINSKQVTRRWKLHIKKHWVLKQIFIN